MIKMKKRLKYVILFPPTDLPLLSSRKWQEKEMLSDNLTWVAQSWQCLPLLSFNSIRIHLP